jgi:multidrug efflux pump subunit AcrA (membrane-fusion protein)
MKFLKWLMVLLVVVLLVVAGVKLVKKRKAEDAHQKTAVIYPINVKVVIPKVEEKTLTLPYLAQVKNDNISLINTKFAGKIEFIKNLGDKVKKGEVVAKIDDTKLRTSLASINANIKANQILLNTLISNHKRTGKLLKAKIASKEKYDNEIAQIEGIKAKILGLKENKESILNDLTYATIISPINGIVSHKFLGVGDNVFAGKPLLQITPKSGNYLVVVLPKEKKEIIYKNKMYPLISFDSTSNGVKTYKADVNDETLTSGEKVNVKVVEFNGKATILPYRAILSINNKNYVLVANGNRAKIKEVTILAKGSEGVAIKENINAPVVTAEPDILLELKTGHPIKVEE